tara:strand:- start:8070 stop:8474 length:405 start_codon:yes stop_codon:yes gene_type:complete
MINSKIIKIAAFSTNTGLKDNYTHKSSMRNSLCGDLIRAEFIVNKQKIISMRYETESCVLCEASASLFSRKIKNIKVSDIVKDVKEFKKLSKNKNISLPAKFKEYKPLIDSKNIQRRNCVILPMEAFLKAFKMR